MKTIDLAAMLLAGFLMFCIIMVGCQRMEAEKSAYENGLQGCIVGDGWVFETVVYKKACT